MKRQWIVVTAAVLMGLMLAFGQQCMTKTAAKAASTSGTVLQFDADGNFTMVTRAKRATSRVKYEVIGWNVKCYATPLSWDNPTAVLKMEKSYWTLDPEDESYVYEYFVCNKDVIFSKIAEASAAWARDLYRYGGTVYFDANLFCIQIRQNIVHYSFTIFLAIFCNSPAS